MSDHSIAATASDIDRVRRNNFICACLEPLSDEVLVDTHYNSLARQAREKEWYRAMAEVEFYAAYTRLNDVCEWFHSKGVRYKHHPENIPDSIELVRCWRSAVARALRTPVYKKQNINWKRRQRIEYVPITQEELDAAIAADEAFIAAHPTKRTGCAR